MYLKQWKGILLDLFPFCFSLNWF